MAPFRNGNPTLQEIEEKRRKEQIEREKYLKAVRESVPRLVFTTNIKD